MPHIVLTEDEVIETLKRSSLPTLVTEGRDDYLVFRKIEERFAEFGLSVLPVGGRSCLLNIFRRREETGRADRIAFIADRDLWVITSIPDEFDDDRLIFTDGYSIENDIYRDANFEALLTVGESVAFQVELDAFLKWYSFAVGRRLDGEPAEIACHPERVLSGAEINPHFAAAVGYAGYPESLFQVIKADYRRLLRGKSLVMLLMRQLSYAARIVKHRHDSLLEIGANSNGPLMTATHDRIAAIL